MTCDDPICISATVEKMKEEYPEELDFYHLPTHDFVKVRTVVHHLQWPGLAAAARGALQRIREEESTLLPWKEHTTPRNEEQSRISSPEDASTTSGSEKTPLCIICKQGVYWDESWFCLDCDGTFSLTFQHERSLIHVTQTICVRHANRRR